MNTVALLLLSIIPHDTIARDRCDVAEVNHFYDEQGRLIFDQLILYDWCPHTDPPRYQVRAWRLVKDGQPLPERNWLTGGYTALWTDSELPRRIDCDGVRETWTQYDPELAEREILAKERRRELTKYLRGLPARLGGE